MSLTVLSLIFLVTIIPPVLIILKLQLKFLPGCKYLI
jgi:hypothetical protein